MVFSLHQLEACRPDVRASRWGGLLHFIPSVKTPCHVVYYLVAVASRHYIKNITYHMGQMARQTALRKGPSWVKTGLINHRHLLWRFFYRNFIYIQFPPLLSRAIMYTLF